MTKGTHQPRDPNVLLLNRMRSGFEIWDLPTNPVQVLIETLGVLGTLSSQLIQHKCIRLNYNTLAEISLQEPVTLIFLNNDCVSFMNSALIYIWLKRYPYIKVDVKHYTRAAPASPAWLVQY